MIHASTIEFLELTLVIVPTDTFTILELKNPSFDITELHKIHRSLDREAQK